MCLKSNFKFLNIRIFQISEKTYYTFFINKIYYFLKIELHFYLIYNLGHYRYNNIMG